MEFKDYVRNSSSYIIFMFFMGIISPILSPFIKSFGFSNFTLSLIFGVFPFVVIFLGPVIGQLSDVFGRDRIIFYGLILELIALIVYVFADYKVMIFGARIVESIAICMINIVGLAKIQDNVDEKKRGEQSGVMLSALSFFKLLGPILGGVMADIYFTKSPFVFGIIILILLILFYLRGFRSKIKYQRIKVFKLKDYNPLSSIKRFLEVRKLFGMAILGMAVHMSLPALTVFLPLIVNETFELSYSYIAITIVAMNLAMLFQFYFGKIGEKNPAKSIFWGVFIYSITLIMVFFVKSYYLLLLVLVFHGIGCSMWNVSAWSYMAKISKRGRREGEVVGSYLSIAKIGALVSYILSGIIVELFGMQILFLIVGMIIILANFFAYGFIRKNR